MKWYLAKLVFQIICGDGDHTPQFDEQLRLVAAHNEDEAFTKAQNMGLHEQDMFYNQRQQLVQWQFINVSELLHLSELIDGAEIYSQIKEVDNADAYHEVIDRKAAGIKEKCSHQLLQLF